MTYNRHQRGVALLFVVFIVFLVALVATGLLSGQAAHIRQLENARAQAQILQYAYAVETWAIEVLQQDRQGSQIDHLNEDWAKPLPPSKVDEHGTRVSGRIIDLDGRFDLNRLVVNGKAQTREIAALKQWAQGQNLETGWIDSLADWMDKDDLSRADGAEDPYYLGLTPAYYTPGSPLTVVNELAYLRHADSTIITGITDAFTALPEVSPLNINTVPESLLPLVIPGLTTAQASALVSQRDQTPWNSTEEFIKLLKEYGVKENGDKNNPQARAPDQLKLAVSSRHFLVSATVEYGESIWQVHSRLLRDDTGAIMIYQREIEYLQ